MALPALLAALAGGVVAEQHLRRAEDRQIELARAVGEINRLDEVLTHAARMYAAAGDVADKERYLREAKKLDEVIARALDLAPDTPARIAVKNTQNANAALVEIEERAMRKCDLGRCADALADLRSDQYERLKRDYSAGMVLAFDQLQQAASHRSRVARLGLTGLAAALGLAVVGFGLLQVRVRPGNTELRAPNGVSSR